MKHYEAEILEYKSQSQNRDFVVYITTPAIPSCFMVFSAIPILLSKISIFITLKIMDYTTPPPM